MCSLTPEGLETHRSRRPSESVVRRSVGVLRFGACLAVILSVACGGGERVVHRQTSSFQDVVVTEASSGVRTLRFGVRGAPQSRFDPREPERLLLGYVRAAMIGLAYVEEPGRVLVVGLGGGSIPMALHRWFPTTQIDVVELDPAVVEVARAWFGVAPSDRLRVEVADGRRFVEDSASHSIRGYDLIVLDAFGADSIPHALSTLEFLEAVREALSPKGRVVANLWSGGGDETYRSMLTTYQAAFRHLALFAVPERGNRIVVAGQEHPPSAATLRARVAALEGRVGELGLLPLLASGDLEAETRDFGAAVRVD